MTGLLVSVRSAAETGIALAGGADLIDIKEPSRGSLGAADPAVWDEVSRVVAGRVPISLALGELGATAGRPSSGLVQYAKLGLAGAALTSDWAARWTSTMRSLPGGTRPVAVAYADWQTAQAPAPELVLAAATRVQSPFLLLDTFDKSSGSLLANLSIAQLKDLSARAADVQMRLVLAGSLDAQSIALLLPLRPAYIAVRGAVCAGDRTQAIDAARVKRLAALVRTSIDTSRI